jgi:hypothetical protein
VKSLRTGGYSSIRNDKEKNIWFKTNTRGL